MGSRLMQSLIFDGHVEAHLPNDPVAKQDWVQRHKKGIIGHWPIYANIALFKTWKYNTCNTVVVYHVYRLALLLNNYLTLRIFILTKKKYIFHIFQKMLNHFPSQIHFFLQIIFLKISASFRKIYYYYYFGWTWYSLLGMEIFLYAYIVLNITKFLYS
jgi:hypothetical protein